MIAHFAKPSTPYAALPWPEFGPHFNDYEHLERVAEWSTTIGERGVNERCSIPAARRRARSAAPRRPTSSAWVEANAGTGKTKVLTDRVTRLLLAGTQPERILCLTFTKAAAAEMRNRLPASSAAGRWPTTPMLEGDHRR